MKANTAISIWHLEICSHLRSPCKYLWEKCPWLYDMHFFLPNLSTGFEFPSWHKSIGFAWGSKSFERVHKYCALLHPVIFMKIFQVMMAFGSLFYLRWQNWGTKWTNTQVTNIQMKLRIPVLQRWGSLNMIHFMKEIHGTRK